MAKNEAKIKFTAETGDFNKAIQKSNDKMSELRAELRLNETQMKTTGNVVEGLENKHRILQDQLKASHDKTEALNQKVQKAVEIFGENSTEASKLRVQLLNAQAAEAKLEQAVKKCADELREFGGEAQDTRTASEKLNDTVKEQQTKLDDLKRKYSDLVVEQKGGTEEAEALAREIEDLSGELKQNKTALSDAADAADKLDRNLDDAGDAAKNSGDGFTVAKGAIADLASEAIQFGIEKVSEFVGYLKELPEATRELRQDMATLNTSFEDVGFSTEQAESTWRDLYAIFGEDDRAVEAANLIAKMSDNEKELNKWVTITQGVWGSYQDSLPVEGLAEASMETARTGTVTGNLADALNWSKEAAEMFAGYMSEDVVTAEDAFNVALSECATEQERQTLITETLTALYGDAATKYEEASGSQIEAKEATADLALAEAELAEKIEPCTTAWDGMKTVLITAVTPAIESVCGWLQDAMTWLQEHPTVLKAVTAAVAVLAVGLSALAIAAGVYTVAQWAMNSAILANPITWIVVAIIAAIAALVAIVVVIVEHWDELKAAAMDCWENIKEAWNTAAEWFDTNVIQPIVNFFTGLWDGIVGVFQSVVDWVKTNWVSIVAFIINPFAGVFSYLYNNFEGFRNFVDGVVTSIKDFFVNLWNGIVDAAKAAWDFICNIVQVGAMLVGEIISAAIQIITLPFRFIWENCKEYVFAAWEWIKSKVSTAINNVKNTITKVWNAVKNVFVTVWNAIKTVVSNVWNNIKSAVSNAVNAVKTKVSAVWNSVKTATSTAFNAVKNVVSNVVNNVKSKVSSAWNGIKSVTSSVFNSVKSTVTSVWNSIKSKITSTINGAKDAVKSAIDKIKGFFNFSWSLPKIKLPHFSITGSFSLNPPKVPRFSIDWYKDGGIMMNPTIFGINGGKLMAGGEAGPEAILPIDRLEGYITGAIEKSMQVVDLGYLANAIEDLANRPIAMNINGRQFALATAGDGDSVNGLRTTFKSRGLVLD